MEYRQVIKKRHRLMNLIEILDNIGSVWRCTNTHRSIAKRTEIITKYSKFLLSEKQLIQFRQNNCKQREIKFKSGAVGSFTVN